MIELAYRCSLAEHENHVYTLMNYEKGDPFAFMIDGVVIGKIDKINGEWKQIEGTPTHEAIIKDMGRFLDEREKK